MWAITVLNSLANVIPISLLSQQIAAPKSIIKDMPLNLVASGETEWKGY